MNQKFKLPLAIAIASAVLVGCSSNKVKEAKPNPLPKLTESKKSLVPVFSRSVSSTNKADPLRLQLDASDGVVFTLDPKGEVAAYRGKQRLWEKKVSKLGLSSGVEAAEGIVVVGNSKGQLFALDQATGEQKWTAQLSGALLSPSLVQSGRVITIANDGTVFAHD
ncbi:MAG: PQQ-binding-like beta-propeller repeat protein, partial [Acinetobacter baumannii]|nr:PQQ-binding-like beta-propeller repeat protein [Acinetobacter baumannii]